MKRTLSNGSNTTSIDASRRNTRIIRAIKSENPDLSRFKQDLSAINKQDPNIFLAGGEEVAAINVGCNTDGDTYLHIAFRQKHDVSAQIKILLECGASF